MPWVRLNNGEWAYKGTGLRVEGQPEHPNADGPARISAATAASIARAALADELAAARAEIDGGWRVLHEAIDWASLRYAPHPDPAKREHYAHNPANRRLWAAKARIEAGLAALAALVRP